MEMKANEGPSVEGGFVGIVGDTLALGGKDAIVQIHGRAAEGTIGGVDNERVCVEVPVWTRGTGGTGGWQPGSEMRLGFTSRRIQLMYQISQVCETQGGGSVIKGIRCRAEV